MFSQPWPMITTQFAVITERADQHIAELHERRLGFLNECLKG
jgi:putative SOS response-associated peptidase YedK